MQRSPENLTLADERLVSVTITNVMVFNKTILRIQKQDTHMFAGTVPLHKPQIIDQRFGIVQDWSIIDPCFGHRKEKIL